MNKYLYLLLSFFLLPSARMCHAQATRPDSVVRTLNRCWRVVSHEVSPIYGLEDEDIKRYSKQIICFTKDSIRMFNSTLYAPKYAISRMSAEDYAKNNFDCGKNKLAIMTDSLYEITVKSVTKPSPTGTVYTMTDVMAFDDDFLYVVLDGVIFKLFATDRKVESKGAR